MGEKYRFDCFNSFSIFSLFSYYTFSPNRGWVNVKILHSKSKPTFLSYNNLRCMGRYDSRIEQILCKIFPSRTTGYTYLKYTVVN